VRQDPTPDQRPASELYLTQPLLIGRVTLGSRWWGRISLNAERATLADGELTPGAWGEGWYDRRHPHTIVHELLLGGHTGGRCGRARCEAAVFLGKGFVPFGSDDPMGRWLTAYPVNHHLAQILERALGGAALRAGPLLAEAALFNGDEPERPAQWPNLSRFADSWSARLTATPLAGVELAASYAEVASPEARSGVGPDQRKWHAGLRVERVAGATDLSGLAEWARTDEVGGFFRFESLLVEGSVALGRHRVSVRAERTDRPEEERSESFRALRPHLDNSLVGVTRWSLWTVQYRLALALGGIALEPLAELTLGSARETAGGLFSVLGAYGKTTVSRLAIGTRIAWRLRGDHRMGRYAGAPEHVH